MKNSFISTKKTRQGKPAAGFILSLFWTGAGEFRYGKKSAGTVLMILRILPFLVIPVILTADPGSSLMTELLVSVIGAAVVTLYSPIRSALLLKGKNEIPEEKMTSPLVLILFIVFNTLLTFAAAGITFSFFSLHRVGGNENIPSLAKGDLLITAALPAGVLPPEGDMVLVKTDRGYEAWRIITDRAVTADIKLGRFTLQGRELAIGTPDEDTTERYAGAPGENMLIETNGKRRYPVLVSLKKESSIEEKETVKVSTGQILLSRDDRRGEKFYIIKKKEEVRQKVVGTLFHAESISFPSVPWL